MAKRIGVLLSGCGFLDGSEIHEAVLTMYHLDRAGAEIVCLAPRMAQKHVVDHGTGEEVPGEQRDVFTEAARIARGKLRDLAEVVADDLDGLVLPGGFGAAKNLCDFATTGPEARAHPEVARLVQEMHLKRKPIGAVCIAPVLIAAVLGPESHPTLTIGEDPGTAEAIVAMGGVHKNCSVTEFTVDRENRIISTPAYMLDARVGDVGEGIGKLVQSVLEMA